MSLPIPGTENVSKLQSLRVLVSEDSLVIRGFIRRTVHSCVDCTHMTECEDGMVALEALNACTADLIITDLNMPRLDGRGFLKQAEEKGLLADAGIIVISSSITNALKDEFRHFPRLVFLRKPSTADDIRGAIRQLREMPAAAKASPSSSPF